MKQNTGLESLIKITILNINASKYWSIEAGTYILGAKMILPMIECQEVTHTLNSVHPSSIMFVDSADTYSQTPNNPPRM